MTSIRTKLNFNDLEIKNLNKLELDSSISCDSDQDWTHIRNSPTRRQVDFQESYVNLLKNYKNQQDDSLVESPSQNYIRVMTHTAKRGILKSVNSTNSLRYREPGSSKKQKVSFSRQVIERERTKYLPRSQNQNKIRFKSSERKINMKSSMFPLDSIHPIQRSHTLSYKWSDFVY